MEFTNDELRELTILKGLPEWVLSWLCEHGTRIELATGDRLFTRGHPADYMFIVAQGTIQRYEEIAGQWLVVASTGTGEVSGMLPFSRMTHYPGHTVATVPSQILRLNKSDFNELLTVSHELGQRLVAEMSNRVRRDVRLEQQREKMVALSRLSAGLAHELNNPTAAIRRTSESLGQCLAEQFSISMKFARENLGQDILDAIERFRKVACTRKTDEDPSPLIRSDREEELAGWFEKHRLEDPWELAGTFTDTVLSIEDFDQFADSVSDDLLKESLVWVAGGIKISQMIAEISECAENVSELVSSVKAYSHMDRSPEHKPTDVREGLDNTIIMFGHRLKEKNIQLMREYPESLPTISANAGELNQVWTNLIDNAIDAMEESGELGIKIGSDNWGVIVKIMDNGRGITSDIINRIFDPFFTTKDVGGGTGLGLDIARRIVQTHGGQIDVRSRPGQTEASVRLPITLDRKIE
jgi:signal transduction histidine kinase